MLASCSLLYNPSSDELSGGQSSGSDAASSSTSSSTSSSGGDGSSADGSGGPTDASDAPFVCPPNALVCDDFEYDALGAGPARSLGDPVGLVSISKAQAHSPSRSLSALLRGGKPSPLIAKSLTNVPSRITLSFWLYAPTPPPDANITFRVADLLWGAACDWEFAWQLDINAQGLRTSFNTYNAAEKPTCGPVDFGSRPLITATQLFVPAWHHITVTNDVGQQPIKKTSTAVDGVPAASDTVKATKTSIPTDLRVSVGIPCIQTTGGCFDWDGADFTVFIDDVTIVPTP